MSHYTDIELLTNALSWRVSEIIKEGQLFLNDQILIPVWEIIWQQPVPNSVINDKWKWNYFKSAGSFSFNSAWEIVRHRQHPYQFANMIWFPSSNPKMAVCLLRALHGKLLTRDFLKSIGVSDIDARALCNSSQESNQHLFFECQFSTYLWSLCRLKFGIPC